MYNPFSGMVTGKKIMQNISDTAALRSSAERFLTALEQGFLCNKKEAAESLPPQITLLHSQNIFFQQAIITDVALIIAVAFSPTASPRSFTASMEIVEVMPTPSATSSFTIAFTAPSSMEETVPFN